jgi:copper(I)-binding protein
MKSFGVKHTGKYLSRAKSSVILTVGLALLAGCGPPAEDNILTLKEAWVRPLPPGMKMTAGFGELTNHGRNPVAVRGWSSPEFGDVSLHQSYEEDGVSRMREVTGLTIAPGETFRMSPGGYHLMLMAPSGPVEAGGTVRLVAELESGQRVSYELIVKRA